MCCCNGHGTGTGKSDGVIRLELTGSEKKLGGCHVYMLLGKLKCEGRLACVGVTGDCTGILVGKP